MTEIARNSTLDTRNSDWNAAKVDSARTIVNSLCSVRDRRTKLDIAAIADIFTLRDDVCAAKQAMSTLRHQFECDDIVVGGGGKRIKRDFQVHSERAIRLLELEQRVVQAQGRLEASERGSQRAIDLMKRAKCIE